LGFEVDGKNVLIERSLKRAKTISQDYCAITIDGEKKELAVTELKNKVLELLNYPIEFSKKQNILYKFTVYTPQEEMKQIILQDSTTRTNTLRHVFGIDKYKKILENSTIITLKLREEKRIKEVLTANLEKDKSDITLKEEELRQKQGETILLEHQLQEKKEIKNKVQEEKQELNKKVEEKRKLEQEIEKSKIMISNKHETILSNQKLVQQINNQMKELSLIVFDPTQISKLEVQIQELKKERQKLHENNITINSQINSLTIKIEENKKLEQKMSSLEVCPTCHQNVDAIYRANVLNKAHNELSQSQNKIQELEIEKNNLSLKLNSIESNIVSNEKEITELQMLKVKYEGIEEKRHRIKEVEQSNQSLEGSLLILKQQIESLRSSVFEFSKYDSLFEQKHTELEQARRHEQIAEIKVAELKREIEVFSRQIDELKIKIAKVETIKEELNYISALEDWISKKFVPMISNIERNVMIKLRAEFSELFNEWFCMLVSDNFNVRLDEEFTPIIEQQDYEIDYAYLSGGERTAIALAYRLSLNQVINSLMSKIKTKDVVILDEPTDGFSEQQLDKMREVLEQLKVKQLIIVSHEQKIEGFVENVIKLSKENGISGKKD
jgi:DNA repair protein SbcC/Rad50